MRLTAHRAIASAIVVPLLLVAAGCGSDDSTSSDKAGEKLAEKMIENGDDNVDVDIDGEEVSIETDEGTTSYGSKDRPEALPDDFPIADGEIVTTMDSPGGAMVSVKTDDDVTDAFDQAVSDLEEQGWTRTMLTNDEGTSGAMFTGDTDEKSVILTGDDSTGELTYVVSLGS